MASSRFRDMVARLAELRSVFLPRRFDPTGSYPANQSDLTRAYRLLCHAEIEACMEDIALQAVSKTCAAWGSSGKPSRSLIGLLAYHHAPPITVELTSSVAPKKAKEIDDAVRDAKRSYSHYVRMSNHGIRATQVRRLLLPAGVQEAQLDGTWLNTIDSFGANRGETAHASAQRTVTLPDPKTELTTVKAIASGLRFIDALLQKLSR